MAGSVPLEIGIGLPTLGPGGTPDGFDIGACARHAEALGFDSVSAADLITGDGAPALEVTVALTAAAAVTARISIATVLSLPLRPAAWVAAQVQALQHISGNRLVLGVGIGGVPDSPFWPAVGAPRRGRGRRTDAALAVLPRLIAGEPTRLVDQPGQPLVTLGPPAPVPPVLVGGNSRAAIRRAATYGDGWLPSQIGPHNLAAGVAELRELAAARGRPPLAVHIGGLTIEPDPESYRAARADRESFVRDLPAGHGIVAEDVVAMVTAGPDEAAERLAAYAEAGADGVSFSPDPGVAGARWLRYCELAAEARDMMA